MGYRNQLDDLTYKNKKSEGDKKKKFAYERYPRSLLFVHHLYTGIDREKYELQHSSEIINQGTE